MMRHLFALICILFLGSGCCTVRSGTSGVVVGKARQLVMDHAILATPRGLVAASLKGKKQTLLASVQGVSWCVVDNRALAVWYTVQDGNGKVRLYVMDLARLSPPVATTGPFEAPDTITLAYGPDRLAGGDQAGSRLGLLIDVASTRPFVGMTRCRGTLSRTCDGQPKDRVNPTEAGRKKALDSLTVRVPRLFKMLRERGRDRHLRAELKRPERWNGLSRGAWVSRDGMHFLRGGTLVTPGGNTVFKGGLSCGFTGATRWIPPTSGKP
jgi:hypothetical protein